MLGPLALISPWPLLFCQKPIVSPDFSGPQTATVAVHGTVVPVTVVPVSSVFSDTLFVYGLQPLVGISQDSV